MKEVSGNNAKMLLKIQWNEFKKEVFLWVFVLIVLILYLLLSYYEVQFAKSAYEGITFSIIAAFIFYLLTDFYPRCRRKRKEVTVAIVQLLRIKEFYDFACTQAPIKDRKESDLDDILNEKDDVKRKLMLGYISGALHTLVDDYLHIWDFFSMKSINLFPLRLQEKIDHLIYSCKWRIQLVLTPDYELKKDDYFAVLDDVKDSAGLIQELYSELNQYI